MNDTGAGAGGTPATEPGPDPAAVRVRGLVKRFGAVEAVKGIDLDVAPGEAAVRA
ncbi:MAG: hypothetical protein ACT4O0_18025 [Pseudonocardia sp.]